MYCGNEMSKKITLLTAFLTSTLGISSAEGINLTSPVSALNSPNYMDPSGGTGAPKPLQDIKIIEMIDYHLRALRDQDIARAYNTTSKEFRNATPPEGFKKFIDSFPILTAHKHVDVKIEALQKNRADVIVILNPEKESIPVEYQLVKEGGLWKIWNIQVISRTSPAISNLLANPELLKQPIQDQLSALKNKEVVKAYDLYTSNQFKKTVSLDVFKQFLIDFPVLSNYDSIKFSTPSIHKGTGLITVELHNEGEITVFGYTLGIEEEKWKIWGLEVNSQPTLENAGTPEQSSKIEEKEKPGLNPQPNGFAQSKTEEPSKEVSAQATQIEKDLIQSITDQLKLIKEGNLQGAYQNFTSKEFQEATSVEQFGEFVRNHSSLFENKASEFGKIFFDNNVGTVTATLTGNDGTLNNVEYSLVNQNGNWKILQMKVFPAKPRAAGIKSGLFDVKSVPFSFSKIVFGSSMNPAGYITDPTTTIKSSSNKLYVNLYVQGGLAGTIVKIQVGNIDTNSNLPPISTTLQQDGDAVVSFVFNPPLEGWPPGNYQAHVTSSTGVSNDYNFTIE